MISCINANLKLNNILIKYEIHIKIAIFIIALLYFNPNLNSNSN